MRTRSTCICLCHHMAGEHLHTNPCCEPDPVNEVYEVTLRVERTPGDDHPGMWDWDDMVGGNASVVRALPEDELILSINYTVEDVAAMGTSDYMDSEDEFEDIPADIAIERAREMAPYIADTARNLISEQLFDAVNNGSF